MLSRIMTKTTQQARYIAYLCLFIVCPSSQAEKLRTPTDQQSYSLGVSIGQQIKRNFTKQDITHDPQILLRGVSDVILGHPLALNDKQMQNALRALHHGLLLSQKKQLEHNATQWITQLAETTHQPVVGKASSPFTIVAFFDYQCPHCKQVSRHLIQFIEQHPDVHLIMREYPVLGPSSMKAARAALAAAQQGHYLAMHHALMDVNNPLTYRKIRALSKQLGLKQKQFEDDIDSAAIMNIIHDNYVLGDKLGVKTTPSLFFFKRPKRGAPQSRVIFSLGHLSPKEWQQIMNELKKNKD